MSTWPEIRPHWIKRVNNVALLSVVADVARQSDEQVAMSHEVALGQHERRMQSILWLATRGAEGKEWGHAGATVMEFLRTRGKNDGTS